MRNELGKMPVDGSIDYPRLVTLTAGFSGAEVVAVGCEAAMLAVDGDAQFLTQVDLEAAISGIEPQITQDMLDFYKNFAAKL